MERHTHSKMLQTVTTSGRPLNVLMLRGEYPTFEHVCSEPPQNRLTSDVNNFSFSTKGQTGAVNEPIQEEQQRVMLKVRTVPIPFVLEWLTVLHVKPQVRYCIRVGLSFNLSGVLIYITTTLIFALLQRTFIGSINLNFRTIDKLKIGSLYSPLGKVISSLWQLKHDTESINRLYNAIVKHNSLGQKE